MITDQFLEKFKQATEKKWQEQGINRELYGFQFQRGTRWNPGLDDRAIADYEASLGVKFPSDFKTFLRKMNGTDLPTLNLYGESGEPYRQSIGVYVYPRDLQLVKELSNGVKHGLNELRTTLEEEGFFIPPHCDFVPIYAHRYILCTAEANDSTVLSIWDASDAILYGTSLAEYLEREFLSVR
jgi:SMI1-KNR4 cell-wall